MMLVINIRKKWHAGIFRNPLLLHSFVKDVINRLGLKDVNLIMYRDDVTIFTISNHINLFKGLAKDATNKFKVFFEIDW